MVVEAGQVEERMEQDEESNNPALDGSSAGLAPLTRPQYKPLPANEMEVRFRGRRGGREGGQEEGRADGWGGGEGCWGKETCNDPPFPPSGGWMGGGGMRGYQP